MEGRSYKVLYNLENNLFFDFAWNRTGMQMSLLSPLCGPYTVKPLSIISGVTTGRKKEMYVEKCLMCQKHEKITQKKSICCPLRPTKIISKRLKKSNKMQLYADIYVTAKLLYMFRASIAPIISST